MKYIAALLFFFNFCVKPGNTTDYSELTPDDLLKTHDTQSICQFIMEKGLSLNNIKLLSSTWTFESTLRTVGCGDQQNGLFQEAFILTVQRPEADVEKSCSVHLLHLGIISPGSLHIFDNNYNNGQLQNHDQPYKLLFMRKSVISNKCELLEAAPDKKTLSILDYGSHGDIYDAGLARTYGKTEDTVKISPILENPTIEAISAFIKAELGRQDFDISHPKLTIKTGLYPLVSGVILVTQHGIPALEEAFFLSMKPHSYFLKSLGKFSCDTFKFLSFENDFAFYAGRKPVSKDVQLLTARMSKYDTAISLITYDETSNTPFEAFTHDDDFIFIVGHNKIGAKLLDSLDTTHLIEEGDWENIINTRFETINGKLYQITPYSDKEYGVYTFQKTKGKYQRIPTNVTSTKYIHTLISDPENTAKILAYQTGTLSQLTWCFCDEPFEQMVSELSSKINFTLQKFNKSSWHFSRIPLGTTNGEIEFDEILLKKQDKKIKISCNAFGEIDFGLLEDIKFIPLAKPEIKMIKGPEDYSIDYAVFRCPNDKYSALPTVMIIGGGPHVFIKHKDHAEKINFFNQHGYHVVIPQGLFRQGYSPEYAINTKGRFGELDMELLRCVLRDLRDQEITSQPVYIMGSSYGGYSCARLGFDSDLVKAAFVENALLDLTTSIIDQYFWTKNGEDDVNKERRLRALSPALEAPLPRVPVFVVGVQNDVRCPITQSRSFAKRLAEKDLPLIYLEHPSGGHNSTFPYLELIKDFFEDRNGGNVPEGYHVMVDSNRFFN